VPLVVPNDSAREAWFTKAPNVFLYRVDPHSRVMPQGYNRRMSTPQPAEAAAIIRRLVKQGGVKPRQRAAGRAFVAEHADHRDVGRRWVEIVEQQAKGLKEERMAMQVVVPGERPERTLQVEMLHGPGLGDLILAAPALQALKRMDPERQLRLRIPRAHLEVAKVLSMADQYDVQGVDEADERVAIHDLYHPEHRDGWSDPRTHRTEVIARHLGVPVEELRPLEVVLDTPVREQVQAQFLEAFGVSPTECVAIAMESGSPHRAMPRGYIAELAQRIKVMGAIPLVVGATGMGVRLHGVLDVSGQTEPTYWMGLLDAVGAVITTDSATLHVAAMLGTPTVGAFPTFDPEARLRYYSGPLRAVVPPEGTIEAGEAWPAGKAPKAEPGTWARHISVDTLVQALQQLMDLDGPAEPQLLEPYSLAEAARTLEGAE
jgi:ADP-heptose:LPS heptosyltransferase